MTRRLLLVRHGESTGQPAEAPLTERGHAQARSLVAQLRGLHPDLILSSPFRRARETIEPLAAACRLPVEIDARFAERILTDEPLDEFREGVRRVMDDFDLRLPGGESSREAQARGRQAIEDMLRRDTRLPVVATHGQLLTLLLNAIDATAGYAVWQEMTNPDVFLIESDQPNASWQRGTWTCTRLPPADATPTDARDPARSTTKHTKSTKGSHLS